MKQDRPEQTPAGGEPAFALPDDTPGYALAERSGWLLLEKKADDVVLIDLRGRSDVCDFFVLATGQSAVQVKALAKHVHGALLEFGHKPKGLEGMNDGRWALMDFFDVVVHVFDAAAREYFQLERLWGDAPRVDLDPDWYARPGTGDRHPDLNFTSATGFGGAD